MYKFLETLHPGGIRTRDLLFVCLLSFSFSILLTLEFYITTIFSLKRLDGTFSQLIAWRKNFAALYRSIYLITNFFRWSER
jgi:hypothetical protein